LADHLKNKRPGARIGENTVINIWACDCDELLDMFDGSFVAQKSTNIPNKRPKMVKNQANKGLLKNCLLKKRSAPKAFCSKNFLLQNFLLRNISALEFLL
jgi:hypothetical protein